MNRNVTAGSVIQAPLSQQIEQGPNKMQQERTMVWAQQNYYWDSGINTAVPTASSLISGVSGASSLIEEDAYPPMYTQDQVNVFNTDYDASRSMRIRAAMFPETINETMNVNTTATPQYDFGQSSNVHRLTESGQLLKTAVVNIINFQDDAERTVKAIPELIKLLSDEDTVIAGQAAQFIHQISKVDAMSLVLASHPNLIEAVLSLVNSSDPETTKHMVGTLFHVSNHPTGLLAIFRSGGIEALVKLLESPIDSVIYYAITTLHNLILHQDGAKEAIRRANGVSRMVNLLKTKSLAKFLAIVLDCLYNLAFNHPETKTAILMNGGPHELVRILNTFDYEKLLWTTSRLIQALSVCLDNKKAIIAAGCLQAFAPHLSHPSQRLVRTILLALRNLSDAALQDDNVEPLLVGLLQLVGSSDCEVVLCCVCILSNLSCSNMRNKATICRNGGVKFLLRTLEIFAPNYGHQPAQTAELLEPTLCTLRHVTIRHPEAEMAQNEVRLYRTATMPQRNGLQLIVDFVRVNQSPIPSAPLMLARPALGILRNVANLAANAQLLGEYSVAQHVCTQIALRYKDVKQAQQSGTLPPLVEGVKCVDMIETCVSALQVLCKNAASRAYVIRANVVPILVELLYYDIETVQCYAAGALSEVANEIEGAKQIEHHGGVAQLTDLLHSKNENIATYSAAVLHALSRNKPTEYQKRLDIELTNSLMREESGAWGQDIDISHVNEDAFNFYDGGYEPSLTYGSDTGMYGRMDGVTADGCSSAVSHYVQQAPQATAVAYGVMPPTARHPGQQPQVLQSAGAMPDWYDTNL